MQQTWPLLIIKSSRRTRLRSRAAANGSCAETNLRSSESPRIGKRYQEEGNKLLAIVGVGGTTETGHVDPLDELADVAKELGCWFHVDAAWGGATLFSARYRDR